MKRINAMIYGGLLISCGAWAVPVNIGSAGDVHFTISIRQGTCELEQDNIEVDMGSVILPRPVQAGRELNQKAFTIALKNCTNVARTYVTMDGLADSTDPRFFALDSGGATGIALKIKTDEGVQQFPLSTDPTPLAHTIPTDGNNALRYIASYVTVSPDAKSGAANAMLNFSVVYE
ncbi:long polar fimbrial protein LpfE [Enterobacter sp. HSTU-ASh6]|nr:long polar fimbrial protein LpfE [Enterobacter sp. HSTU-ASh6]MCX4180294.1 long polar fimbrial protein LpfE [Enterobacter sp. HSTU-ASh6]